MICGEIGSCRRYRCKPTFFAQLQPGGYLLPCDVCLDVGFRVCIERLESANDSIDYDYDILTSWVCRKRRYGSILAYFRKRLDELDIRQHRLCKSVETMIRLTTLDKYI
jgi:hypothetical protein